MSFPLHIAARNGDLTSLTSQIGEGANLDQRDPQRRTALHLAAWAGHLDCVKALLAAGANESAVAQDDMNALHFAATKGHVDVLRWLLTSGAVQWVQLTASLAGSACLDCVACQPSW